MSFCHIFIFNKNLHYDCPEHNSEVDPNDLTGETEILEDELREQDHHDLDQRDTEVDDQGPRVDPNQTYYFKNLLRGRFRHNRREIYVKWEDGSKTWEPDASFTPEQLEHINAKFTKMGKVRKSCFHRKY